MRSTHIVSLFSYDVDNVGKTNKFVNIEKRLFSKLDVL